MKPEVKSKHSIRTESSRLKLKSIFLIGKTFESRQKLEDKWEKQTSNNLDLRRDLWSHTSKQMNPAVQPQLFSFY